MKPAHLLLVLVVMAVWGGNFVVIKLAVGELPPMLFMTVRYVATVILLAPFMARETSRLPGLFALSVTLGFLHFALAFTGLVAIDASVAAVLQQTQVPFAALLAAALLGERVGWWRTAFMGVAFVGVIVLAGEPRTASQPLFVAMAIAGSLMWAIASLQAKRLGPIDPFAINGWIAAFAAPQMLAASLVFESGPPRPSPAPARGRGSP
jgi:O-acetylserine/cysteine efflux transporter